MTEILQLTSLVKLSYYVDTSKSKVANLSGERNKNCTRSHSFKLLQWNQTDERLSAGCDVYKVQRLSKYIFSLPLMLKFL